MISAREARALTEKSRRSQDGFQKDENAARREEVSGRLKLPLPAAPSPDAKPSLPPHPALLQRKRGDDK